VSLCDPIFFDERLSFFAVITEKWTDVHWGAVDIWVRPVSFRKGYNDSMVFSGVMTPEISETIIRHPWRVSRR